MSRFITISYASCEARSGNSLESQFPIGRIYTSRNALNAPFRKNAAAFFSGQPSSTVPGFIRFSRGRAELRPRRELQTV